MDPRPVVSCVVPVFNGARFLEEAVESIEAQSWRPLEIVVIDDGSTDETPAVMARLGNRIRALSQPNQGPSAARNAGIAAASGDFIGFLDCDDRWLPEKTAIQMARFGAMPELELSRGQASNWWTEGQSQEGDGVADTMSGISTALVRRGLFDRIGMFDPSLRHLDWTEWLLRAADLGIIAEALPDTLALRRIHRNNLSRNRAGEDVEERIRVTRQRLARLRGARP